MKDELGLAWLYNYAKSIHSVKTVDIGLIDEGRAKDEIRHIFSRDMVVSRKFLESKPLRGRTKNRF